MWFTFGLAGFVLLIACANLANLQLVRTATRSREFAVRTALGAGRWRLMRQCLTESLMIALLGGTLSVVFAILGVEFISRRLCSELPGASVALDCRVFGFALLCSVLTGLFFGMVPAWLTLRTKVNQALKENLRGAAGQSQHRLRHALIIGEVAFALILLAGAGLFLRWLQRFGQVDPGNDIQGKPVPPLTIIGVVGDVKHQGLENDSRPELYLPYAQVIYNSYSIPSKLVIHTAVDPLNLAAAVSSAIHTAHPDLPVADVGTMATRLDELVAQRRLRMTLLTAYAGLALLLAAASPGLSQSSSEAETLFQRARKQYVKGDLDGAIDYLSKVIELTTLLRPEQRTQPVDPAVRPSARSEAQTLGVIDPRAVLAYTARVIAHQDRQDYEAALADFNRALRLSARQSETYLARGMTWQAKGELRQAEQDYTRALELNPQYADAYNNRGVLLAEQGRLTEALKDFDEAIRINARQPLHFANRGRARRMAQDAMGAISDFTRAIDLNPKTAWYYVGRGVAHFDEQQLATARDDFDQAIKLDPTCAEAYCNRALVQLLQGKDAAAEADLARCLKLKPAMQPLLEELVVQTKALRAKKPLPR